MADHKIIIEPVSDHNYELNFIVRVKLKRKWLGIVYWKNYIVGDHDTVTTPQYSSPKQYRTKDYAFADAKKIVAKWLNAREHKKSAPIIYDLRK